MSLDSLFAMLSSSANVDNSYTPAQDFDTEQSRVYNVQGAKMTVAPDLAIPVVYGRSPVSPNLINYYVEEGEHDTLNMLFGLCEGEIKGVSNIKVGDASIEELFNNEDIGDYAQNAEIVIRKGTVDQLPITGFEDIHRPETINQKLEYNQAYTYTTTVSNVEGFKIAFWMDKLYQVDDNNVIRSWYQAIRIEYRQYGDADWIVSGVSQFDGLTETLFKRYFKSKYLTPGKYEIRVTKVSDDEDNRRFGSVTLHEIDEITTRNLSYPSTATMAIRLITSESISNVSCIVDGKLVRCPDVRDANGDKVFWEDYYYDSTLELFRKLGVGTHLVWDGTSYRDEWCANPAWCLRDFLLSKRYGLGSIFTSSSMLDDDSFLAAALFCDEGVTGLNSNMEKRMRIDLTIDVLRPGDEWINTFCNAMRCMPDYSHNRFRLIIEKQEDCAFIFNNTNILPGSYTVDYISEKSIANVLNLVYPNKDIDYKRDTYSLPDIAAVNSGEVLREKKYSFFGVTRTSQVLREGRILLNKLKTNIKPIRFKTGISAFTCQEGDVFFNQSDLHGWGEGGRCVEGCTTKIIKLDKFVTLELGTTYEIALKYGQNDRVQTRQILTSNGSFDTIEVTTAFDFNPERYNEWYIYVQGTAVKYRVAKIARYFNGVVDVAALNYDEDVYDPTNIETPKDDYKYLVLDVPLVTNLTCEEQATRLLDGTIDDVIYVSFLKPVKSARYIKVPKEFEIYISDNDGKSWSYVSKTDKATYTIRQPFVQDQQYKIAVTTVTTTGEKSKPATSPQYSVTIQGWKTPPSDVENFRYEFEDEIKLSWDKVSDPDLSGYEIRTEYQNFGADDSSFVWRGKADNYTIVRPTARDGIRYYIKAYNNTGIFSDNYASVVPVNAAPTAPALVLTNLFQKAFLMWNDSTDVDLVEYEVWQNTVDTWIGIESETEKLVAKSKGTSAVVQVPFLKTYFRVRAMDKFGGGDWSNSVEADQVQILSGDVGEGEIQEVNIGDDSITAPKIVSGAILAAHIAANQITADKMDVACLSAISANMGCLTAGTLVGACIKTSEDNWRTEINRDGIFSYDDNGCKLVELCRGNIVLYDPLCSDIYSCLDAGSLVFHTPYGDVPYLKRLCSGVACAGQTITLCQWQDMPQISLGIKRLSSYDPSKCESCQEWCVYADGVHKYNNGGGDFGWKFDIHSRLVVSGGTRDECVYLDNFGIAHCTGVNTCEILVKELFQFWCHAAAPSNYYYGILCYQVRYRCLGCGVWCCCNYCYTQPYGSVTQMKITNIACQTINLPCGETWEVVLCCSALNWYNSGIPSGGTTCELCCYWYPVDCSYYTTCILSQNGSFNNSFNLNGVIDIADPNCWCGWWNGFLATGTTSLPIQSGSVNCCCINWGAWDTGNYPICRIKDTYWITNGQMSLCIPNQITVTKYVGCNQSGTMTVQSTERVTGFCTSGSCLHCLCWYPMVCMCVEMGVNSGCGSPSIEYDTWLNVRSSAPASRTCTPSSFWVCECESSYNCWDQWGTFAWRHCACAVCNLSIFCYQYGYTSLPYNKYAEKPNVCVCAYGQVCGNWNAKREICYKVCLVCQCLCCYWYPVPCGGSGSCEYSKWYSMRDTTATECVLDAYGEVNFLAVAYS